MDITGWIADFFGQIGDLLSGLLSGILSILPDSPFQLMYTNTAVNTVLGYVNYFLPLNFIVGLLESWLVAIGIFYVYQLFLRWIKAIE